VVAFFTILKGAIQGAIEPSITNTVEHLRKGTLDFLLLKPADAEFMVSTTRLQPWRATDVLGGLALLVYALSDLQRAVSFGAAFCRLGGSVCDTTGFTFSSMGVGDRKTDLSSSEAVRCQARSHGAKAAQRGAAATERAGGAAGGPGRGEARSLRGAGRRAR